jgi:hypothetical protein
MKNKEEETYELEVGGLSFEITKTGETHNLSVYDVNIEKIMDMEVQGEYKSLVEAMAYGLASMVILISVDSQKTIENLQMDWHSTSTNPNFLKLIYNNKN